MLRKYKNGFLDIIKKEAAVIGSPDFISEDNGDKFMVKLSNSPFVFITRQEANNFHNFTCEHTCFKPGFPIENAYFIEKIDIVYEKFGSWLTTHVKEYVDDLSAPDLWDYYENEKTILNDPLENRDTTFFNQTEKEHIRLSIKEFELLIEKEIQPSAKEMSVINDRLGYLSEALDRLNRVDWKSIVYSTLISITIALSLDTQKGKILFNLFKKVFSNAIQLLQ